MMFKSGHNLENEAINLIKKGNQTQCLNKIISKNVKKFGKYKIQAVDRSGRFNSKGVNYTSINTFNGLEADVVMIIDTDKPEQPDNILLYTQVSRAKHLLYVFRKQPNF